MTKKCFAALKSAQEIMAQIEQLTQDTSHKPMFAYETVKKVNELSAKWNKDFSDLDPSWQPAPKKEPSVREQAMALAAYVQK